MDSTDERAPVGLDESPQQRLPTSADPPDAATLLGRPMPSDRLRGWLVTLVLTLIGGIIRLQDLGFPTDNGTPVFDEKHYVPQAWQLIRNGGYEDNPGYELVVHPPLGKDFIGIGEYLFGYNAWGWRIAGAIAGTVMILLIIRIARRLTRSTLLGGIAGVLFICDGLTHVQDRLGMLDVFLAMFVLASFGCLLCDRDQARARMATAIREGWATESPYGPRLGFRWWRFATGVCLGLACADKWDGIYWVAGFGALVMFWDATARRKAGVEHPWWGAIRRDLLPALWAILAVPLLVYLACWWSWFASETGVDRHAAERGLTDSFGWLPQSLRSLLYYSGKVLNFHEHLVTTPQNHHPWESKPWTWPMSLRPMLYYYSGATTGCGESSCVSATMIIGTPAMWWLAFPMLGWAFWRAIARLDWRYAAVLVGYLAGFLPWFLNLDRQMYFFYMLPVVPFMVMGIVLALGQILGSADAGYERRRTGILVVALYVGLVVANFAWLWPILNGDPITQAHWQAELWLPSWR
ncbi:MAG: dolichyl-phosphate-mannose--protein mannosyltransferase [Sciscionella sp.]